ncbi:O-antigen ligase family protein [Flavobacterium sp. LB2R40]|uniref:O-antigen ligase family protein n=1 Tax=unclassified Flavobacterium TaxID=196869 RepID=UPI003AAE1C0E
MKEKIGFFAIFVLFFFSSDTLSSSILSAEVVGLLTQILYVVLVLLLLLNLKNNQKNIWAGLILSLLCILVFFTAIANGEFSLGYVIQAIVLIVGYVMATKIDFRFFIDKYCQILYYLSLLSICLFFLFLSFPNLINLFPVVINVEDEEYVNLFFYVHYINMYRNTGIFREPGMFMVYLNIGVLFQFLFYKEIKRKYLITYSIALLTTLSTGGFVVFAFLSFVYLLKSNKIKNAISFAFIFIVLCVFILSNFELFQSTFAKFDSSSNEYGSTVARISSVTVPTQIFIDSPFFGVGLSNFKDLYGSYSQDLLGFSLRADAHSTNTLFNSLGTYGFFFFIILLIGVYKFSSSLSNRNLIKILVFISLLLMLGNEDLRYSLLFSLLLFYGFVKNGLYE